MFIVDFDDTLFDTFRYKHARMDALQDLGVSRELSELTYQACRIGYTDERHAALIAKHGFNIEAIEKAFADCQARAQEFVFSDSVPFLSFLKSTGRSVVLLSLGGAVTQEAKLKASGLHNWFDRVFIVVADKISIVRELIDGVTDRPVWLFNDKVQESVDLARVFPDVKVVMKRSPSFAEEAYQQSGLPHFQTLTEIQAYVAKHLG
ncbi:MAG: hypothetical protein HY983_01420 [Candidatus Magasanikbacteria bacterium]|nr:hypothetical protein [Candidatus Magasanikbacteria bacterium]